MDSSKPSKPNYAIKAEGNYIKYSIFISGLTVKTKFIGSSVPENGKIECRILDTGFDFKFTGSNDLTNQNYHLVISNFPCKILPDQSSWKCRNGAVDVKLRVPTNPEEVEVRLQKEAMTEDPVQSELKQ
ncbi:unnamed protein product [Hymenolepis diminuta]|uniref:CS domain-containing protein n=1 Tax=Hymenolepis diminuta TaxID=6216 RepID=A0A564ZAQ4_HYMDI|nr:unnamed protein product [Hymenolepis diminuta]